MTTKTRSDNLVEFFATSPRLARAYRMPPNTQGLAAMAEIARDRPQHGAYETATQRRMEA